MFQSSAHTLLAQCVNQDLIKSRQDEVQCSLDEIVRSGKSDNVKVFLETRSLKVSANDSTMRTALGWQVVNVADGKHWTRRLCSSQHHM